MRRKQHADNREKSGIPTGTDDDSAQKVRRVFDTMLGVRERGKDEAERRERREQAA